MGKPIILNIICIILLITLFVSPVFAQLHDVIPSSAFILPPSSPPTAKLTVTPSPAFSTAASSRLENNILGVQQRNPALITAGEEVGEQDLIGKLIGSLLVAMGTVWFYKNRKDTLARLKK